MCSSSQELKMANPSTLSSPKFLKTSSNSSTSLSSSEASGLVRCSQGQQPLRLQARSGGTQKERASDKFKAFQKSSTKEQTKPLEIKLHTELRAVKRAGFNFLVACKMSLIEQERRQEERIQKIIEEEEIKMLRKEMIPRAQLMPLFDRPFFPQRSTRPLTIPREPSFQSVNSKGWRCVSGSEPYNFQQFANQSRKPIK